MVGTILSVVNQGSVVLGGEASWLTGLRVGVNYLTPFVVASIGYLAGFRAELGSQVSRTRTAPLSQEPVEETDMADKPEAHPGPR